MERNKKLDLLCCLDAFPGGAELDEDAFFLDSIRFIELDEASGFSDLSILVKGKPEKQQGMQRRLCVFFFFFHHNLSHVFKIVSSCRVKCLNLVQMCSIF